jgi:hypothetical protein
MISQNFTTEDFYMHSGNLQQTFKIQDNPIETINVDLLIDDNNVHCTLRSFDETNIFFQWVSQYIPGTLEKLNTAIETALETGVDLNGLSLPFTHAQFIELHQAGGLAPITPAVIDLEKRVIEKRKQISTDKIKSDMTHVFSMVKIGQSVPLTSLTISATRDLYIIVTRELDGVSIGVDNNDPIKNRENIAILKQLFDALSEQLKEDSHILYTLRDNGKHSGLYFNTENFITYFALCESKYPGQSLALLERMIPSLQLEENQASDNRTPSAVLLGTTDGEEKMSAPDHTPFLPATSSSSAASSSSSSGSNPHGYAEGSARGQDVFSFQEDDDLERAIALSLIESPRMTDAFKFGSSVIPVNESYYSASFQPARAHTMNTQSDALANMADGPSQKTASPTYKVQDHSNASSSQANIAPSMAATLAKSLSNVMHPNPSSMIDKTDEKHAEEAPRPKSPR